jgi:hypothetical protein
VGIAAGPAIAAIGAAAAGATVAQVLTTFFVNLILSGLSLALAGKRKRDPKAPINVTVRSTSEYRRVVFGERRVHGSMVYYRTSSPNSDNANKYLWYVVVFAGHQVEEISDVWIDKVRVDAGDIDGVTGNVTATEFDGKMNIWKYLGTSAQTAQTDLIAALGTDWTSNHRLRGNAYLVIRMERDDGAYPFGAPQDISVLMKGALCFDPREGSHDPDDPSTWEYTANPILHARWVITGGSVINDDTERFIRYGCREEDSRIDDDYVTAAANICDELVDVPNEAQEPRFADNIELSCGEKRGEWIKSILASCAGQAVYVQGKWRLYAAAYDSPTHAVTDADIKGEIQIDDLTEFDEAYNKVTSIYYPSHKQYVEDSGPIWADSGYFTDDGEELDPKELDLRGVTSIWQAERLERLALLKSRDMQSIEFPGGLDLMKIAPWETFTMTNTRLGWSGVVFRLLERELRVDEVENLIKPILRARIESSTPYADLEAGDYLGDSTPEAGGRDVGSPEGPSDLTATGQTDGILLKWTGSGTPGVKYQLQESTSSSMTSPVDRYLGPDTQVLLSKSVTTTFYYRVRSFQIGGTSAWEPPTGSVAGAASAISGGFRATASTSSLNKFGTTSGLTTASVTVTAVNGTPGYTYAWTWASGGTSITIGSASAATTTFSVSGMAVDEERSGVARCTVTDSGAATATVDVNVHLKRVSSS